MQSTNTLQSSQTTTANMRFDQGQSINTPIESKLIACFSQDPKEIRRAQQLRARVFNLVDNGTALDKDKFDDICLHLLVKDTLSNNIVGYSRILTSDLVSKPNEFYSASEFDLNNIIKPNQRYMEIGRTCVDPNFRSGAVIGMLWSKIGRFMNEEKIDHLMGCASISMLDGGATALAVVNHLREKHFSSENLRVMPKTPLPQFDIAIEGKKHIPALLKTYLRMGAKVCGEAYLDREFNVADVLILLAKKDISPRYLRHFS
jgi:putative hemolysin